MTGWRTVQLGVALELAYGKALPKSVRAEGGLVPVYGSNGVAGSHDEVLVGGPTVIVGRKGSAGAVHYVDGPCYPIDTTYFVRPRAGFDFDMKFLFYLLRKLDLARLRTATGVPGLTREDVYREAVPVPPIEDQRRIVDLLSRAEGIVRLRREAQKKAAEIIPALFLDMFGDPATNPMGWPRKQIRALGRVVTGTTPPSVNEGMFDGSIPFVTPGDLTRDTVRTGRFLTEAGAQKSRVVRSGATLVCCIGATIGKTDRTWVRSALNQQINAVEWSTEVDDEFGVECLRQSAHVVRTMGGQTALPILKKSLFEVIQIPIPPKSQQQLFAERVTILRSIVRQQVEAASVAEATFNALLGRAFSEGVLPFSEPTGGQVAA